MEKIILDYFKGKNVTKIIFTGAKNKYFIEIKLKNRLFTKKRISDFEYYAVKIENNKIVECNKMNKSN